MTIVSVYLVLLNVIMLKQVEYCRIVNIFVQRLIRTQTKLIMNDTNDSNVTNVSVTPEQCQMAKYITENRNPFSYDILLTIIPILYITVITVGVTGNALTLFVALRKSAMLTNRNLFIINLALADFFLCSVTTPLNLYNLLHPAWPLGNIACKAMNGCFAFTVFLSTLSISAIGLDR
jgi:hypothetical protein